MAQDLCAKPHNGSVLFMLRDGDAFAHKIMPQHFCLVYIGGGHSPAKAHTQWSKNLLLLVSVVKAIKSIVRLRVCVRVCVRVSLSLSLSLSLSGLLLAQLAVLCAWVMCVWGGEAG